MKLWTMLQEPLSQAALFENGNTTKKIPNHPPGTLSRQVKTLGEFDGNLLIGRRNNIEMWTPDGSQMIKSVYHPWIYGLHEVLQWGDELLLACANLDCVFTLDWEGNSNWSWWAWKEGYSTEPTFLNEDNWQTRQITDNFTHKGSVHLNSIKRHEDKVLVTLMWKHTIVSVKPYSNEPSELVAVLPRDARCPHDYFYHEGVEIYGRDWGIVIDGELKRGFSFVKRIYPLRETILFTHEQGIVEMDYKRKKAIRQWTLPKPFGFVLVDSAG